ncbi:MAG: hypothetical protein ACRDTG_17225 [Pseudonocardiaceae bacterium]
MKSLQSTPGDPSILPRHLHHNVTAALLDTRVVAVVGPRQAGKSTLVRQIVTERPGARRPATDRAITPPHANITPVGQRATL